MGEHLAMKPFSNKKENSVENLYPEGKIDKVPKDRTEVDPWLGRCQRSG